MTEDTPVSGHDQWNNREKIAETRPSANMLECGVQEHIDRGLNLFRRGKPHDAFVEFLQVLAVEPNDPLGHYLCGLTLQALDLEEMAVAEWAAVSSLYVRDGGKWDSDWDWIKQKSHQFAQINRNGYTA
jgi:hypothetical protein